MQSLPSELPSSPTAGMERAGDDVRSVMRESHLHPGIGDSIRLRRGVQMPGLGLGTGRERGVTEEEGRRRLMDAICAALRSGYRLIDTTLFSRQERDVVAGIRLAGFERTDVFIATKLLQSAHASEEAVRASLTDSLSNLDTGYIDLYMIHNPRAGRIMQVWPVLLELRDQGLIRVLGVSNFGVEQLEGMRLAGLELPEVNQVEVHCWRQLPELIEYHQSHGIATMCMAPLARGEMFNQTDLAHIAQELGRTEAEVAIRWSLQRGYIPIPKSLRPERVAANTATGFCLSDEHMARISQLDTGFMVCTKASPCHQLPWALIANERPEEALWDESKKRKAEAATRRAERERKMVQRALAKRAEQEARRSRISAERGAARQET